MKGLTSDKLCDMPDVCVYDYKHAEAASYVEQDFSTGFQMTGKSLAQCS